MITREDGAIIRWRSGYRKNQMAAIHEELKRMESISPDNDELLYTLQVIAITLDGLKGEDE